jgi:hypothetical protein
LRKFDPRLLSPEQLEIVQYALRLMVQASRVPDVGETVIEQDARSTWNEGEDEQGEPGDVPSRGR